jgi:hypothetical protein
MQNQGGSSRFHLADFESYEHSPPLQHSQVGHGKVNYMQETRLSPWPCHCQWECAAFQKKKNTYQIFLQPMAKCYIVHQLYIHLLKMLTSSISQ